MVKLLNAIAQEADYLVVLIVGAHEAALKAIRSDGHDGGGPLNLLHVLNRLLHHLVTKL